MFHCLNGGWLSLDETVHTCAPPLAAKILAQCAREYMAQRIDRSTRGNFWSFTIVLASVCGVCESVNTASSFSFDASSGSTNTHFRGHLPYT